MNQNKKKIFIVALVAAILTIVYYFSFYFFKESHNVKLPEARIESRELSQTLPKFKTNIKNQIESIVVKEGPVNENIKNTEVFLNVFDKTYSAKTEEGINVYDAMKSIDDSSFSFKATNYSSLGYFVEEINGVKGTPGKYWIYYVNGQKASVGISNYILKSGDIISWKQEGI